MEDSQLAKLMELPNEIIILILLRCNVGALCNLLKVNNPRLNNLIYSIISQRFSNSKIKIKVFQENHWFMESEFQYVGYNNKLNQLTFQVINGSGIRLHRFFYAMLVSKPIAHKLHFKIDNKIYNIDLNEPIRLNTNKSGIKVSRPLDSHCSFLYTVEHNNEIILEQRPEYDSPGVRWITPLSFQCNLELFDNIQLIKQGEEELEYQVQSFKYLLKRALFDFKQVFNLNPIAAPTPSLLSPRNSINIKDKSNTNNTRRPPILSV